MSNKHKETVVLGVDRYLGKKTFDRKLFPVGFDIDRLLWVSETQNFLQYDSMYKALMARGDQLSKVDLAVCE